jgi:GxxExxY protein
MELLHKEVTEQIIGACFDVYRHLGYGFLEKVYQRAMKVELELRGMKTEIEPKIKVTYKQNIVGDYQADLFVKECVMVELKVAEKYNRLDEAQLLNALKATGIKGGLLINFGRHKAEFKRFVF